MDKNNKRIALVTGATGGIGSSICRKFAEAGYHVVAQYRDEAKKDEWLAKMQGDGWLDSKQIGETFSTVKFDVTDYEGVGKAIDELRASIGTVDILVNNAGITRDVGFRKMTPDQWHAVIATNLTSVFNCTRHVINDMVANTFGRVINISSVNGQRGQFGQANYSAAKAGMHGFAKSLAMEVANKGVTVNTVSPGYIGTDMVMAVREEIRNQIVAGIPVGRLGTPDEIADAVVFLASPNAAFITGANISVNGGQHVY